MDSQLDAEWLQAVQQFEPLRAETTVNFEVPQNERIRLSPEILQFIEAQGEVRLSRSCNCHAYLHTNI